MSSNPDFSSLPIANGHMGAPSCTMCARKKESVSRCTTCHHYLCNHCSFAHEMMVCFKIHKVVALADYDPVEKPFDREPGKGRPKSRETKDKPVKDQLKCQLLEGKEEIKKLSKLSTDLKNQLTQLGRDRLLIIEHLNEVHKQYQDRLTTERNEIVKELDEKYTRQQTEILAKKEDVDLAIKNFSAVLANVTGFLQDNGEVAGGLDLSKLNGFANQYWQDWEERSETSSLFSNIVNESSTLPFISKQRRTKCRVNPDLSLTIPDSPTQKNTIRPMQIQKMIGQRGDISGQFNAPHGFCLGFDEDIVVADSGNHRIQIFDSAGRFKSQFGLAGRRDGHLWHPRKLALLPFQRRYIVCDRGYERSRMQIFAEDGCFVKKICLHYVDIVAGIAVTESEDIVVVDSVTPTVFIIGTNDFLRSLDCTDFMEEPSDIAVRGKEFYVCDFKGHCVVVLDNEGNCLRKFGNKHLTIFPNGIDVSVNGDVLIGDSHGNFFHVAVFSQEGEFIAEFRCPDVKVSRCCGLKIKMDGSLVTVDKNYHHIIVLDTLYLH